MKKFLSLFIAFALAASVSGCGKTDETGNSAYEPEYKVSEVPEEGWNIESILENTYLCGKQLGYPVTLEMLGDDFSIDTENSDIGKNGMLSVLLYKDNYICTVTLKDIDDISKLDNNTVLDDFFINSGLLSEEISSPVMINGVGIGNSADDVERLMGDYNRTESRKPYQYILDKEKGAFVYFHIDNKSNTVTSVELANYSD